MISAINEMVGFWTWLVQDTNVSILLAIVAVAVTAIADLLVRFARARTARRLRIAATAYAQREIANHVPLSRSAIVRLSALV